MKKMKLFIPLAFILLSANIIAQDVVVGDTSALSEGKAMEIYNLESQPI